MSSTTTIVGGPSTVVVINNAPVENTFVKSKYLIGMCCPLETDSTTVGTPYTRVDHSTLCNFFGRSRAVMQTRSISSYAVQGTKTLCGSRAAILLRQGWAQSVAAWIPFADHKAAAGAVRHYSNVAHGDVLDLSTRQFTKGGKCTLRTLWSGRIKKTQWSFGPGASLNLMRDEVDCMCPSCFETVAHAGTRLPNVKATVSYNPVGPCACVDTPMGTCTTSEFVGLLLDDHSNITGATASAQSKMIVSEIQTRQRSPFLPAESVVKVIKGTDAIFGLEAELIVTTERLTLKTFTQSPCIKVMSCGLCLGEYYDSIRLEDVMLVSAMEPSAGQLCASYGKKLAKAGAGILFGLLGLDFVLLVSSVILLPIHLLGLLVSLLVATLCVFCRKTHVFIGGSGADVEFRIRPGPDMQLSALDVANNLADLVKTLQEQKAAAEGHAAAGAGKATVVKTNDGSVIVGGSSMEAPPMPPMAAIPISIDGVPPPVHYPAMPPAGGPVVVANPLAQAAASGV